jgi:hypothetical protein
VCAFSFVRRFVGGLLLGLLLVCWFGGFYVFLCWASGFRYSFLFCFVVFVSILGRVFGLLSIYLGFVFFICYGCIFFFFVVVLFVL